jgi:hypothetical protein
MLFSALLTWVEGATMHVGKGPMGESGFWPVQLEAAPGAPHELRVRMSAGGCEPVFRPRVACDGAVLARSCRMPEPQLQLAAALRSAAAAVHNLTRLPAEAPRTHSQHPRPRKQPHFGRRCHAAAPRAAQNGGRRPKGCLDADSASALCLYKPPPRLPHSHHVSCTPDRAPSLD